MKKATPDLCLFRMGGVATSAITHELERMGIPWVRCQLLNDQPLRQRAEIELKDGDTILVTVVLQIGGYREGPR